MTNHDVCGDNRFELIEKYKNKLLDGTNIDKSKDEMAVIDSILFRFWQMRWLDKLEQFDRQKADVERLQRRNTELDAELDDLKRDDLPRCKDALRRANEIGMGLEKENQELKAEIERLTNTQRIDPNDFCGVLCDFAEECIAKAKADAIKEFAERIKLLNQENLIIWNEQIDNLVKEMVGGV